MQHQPQPSTANHPVSPPVSISEEELNDRVCNLFFNEGKSATEIEEEIKKVCPNFNRQQPYRIIQEAARLGSVIYRSPRAKRAQEGLKESLAIYGIQEVVVTPTHRKIARDAAGLILSLSQQIAAQATDGKVRIGWAAGHMMRAVAEEFASLLRTAELGEIKEFELNTVVGAWQPKEPAIHPNSFSSHFTEDIKKRVDCSFGALYAPVLVKESLEEMKKDRVLGEAFEQAPRNHLIVTSVGLRDIPGNCLEMFYKEYAGEKVSPLEQHGVIGDYLGLPFASNGPVDLKFFSKRPLTLLGPSDLLAMINRGHKILLVEGKRNPFDRTRRTKVIVPVVKSKLATHLVLDLETANDLVASF